MNRTSFFIPDPQMAALKKIAAARDVSVAELIRKAIDEFLEKQHERKRSVEGHQKL